MEKESTKLNSGALTTYKQSKKLSESQRKEICVRLAAIAEATGENLSPKRIDLYLQALSDLAYEKLIDALSLMVTTCEWFPKIPHIREAVLGKQKDNEDAEAEAAWLRVLAYANLWHPDIGVMTGCPKINQREKRSLEFAGGIYKLWTLQDDAPQELDFMRKAFIESYKRSELVDHALALAEFPKRAQLPENADAGLEPMKDILKKVLQ